MERGLYLRAHELNQNFQNLVCGSDQKWKNGENKKASKIKIDVKIAS